MARFPRIDSPCPYTKDRATMFDGDFCRVCRREVVDMTAWSDDERVRFLASCETEVCVSYRRPVRPALVAATMAAAVAALPAVAQDAPASQGPSAEASPDWIFVVEDEPLFMGAIKDPKRAVLIEDPADATLPDLPVVYETSPVDAKPADPVSRSGPRPSTSRSGGSRAGSRR